jgi:hypothetical protein
MIKTIIILIFMSASASVSLGQTAQDFTRELTYRGTKLDGEVFQCTSDRVTSAGFRRDAVTGAVTEMADVVTQRNITTWRVMLKGNQAEVVGFTGATQTLEAVEKFSVRRGPGGVMLTKQDGLSTQTITIDLSNSSFVYSGQDVSIVMNRTNIFVGSCRPYL